MAIELGDIAAVASGYLDNVTIEISPVRPTAGKHVNPNETFTFDVAVFNRRLDAQGGPLKNVKYSASAMKAARSTQSGVRAGSVSPIAQLVVPMPERKPKPKAKRKPKLPQKERFIEAAHAVGAVELMLEEYR